MTIIFVHGWSVRNTNAYGGLPRWLSTQAGPDGERLRVANLYLGRYISFDDSVTLDDIARAFDQAVQDELAATIKKGERFACVTHSTGGPVIRKWMDLYHRNRLEQCPLSHLIMLAPANHGSALAQLGKSRLSRIASLFHGVEPGERVLDWLELGSDPQWELNEDWLDYDCVAAGVFPFTLIGQKIDRSLYDALNSYTDEIGSDGVVRVAAANLNYSFLSLVQQPGDNRNAKSLGVKKIYRSKPTAFGVLPRLAHSGEDIGIIRSVSKDGERPARIASALGLPRAHPTAQWVLRCLRVTKSTDYDLVSQNLAALTSQTQADERVDRQDTLFGTREYRNSRCLQAVFRLIDDRGQTISDYDLYLTAGPDYSDQHLPPGFFVDRQRNRRNPGKLTYYLDYDVVMQGLDNAKLQGNLGFRVVARPASGLAFYRKLEFQSTLSDLRRVLVANETMMVEIVLQRMVDVAVFRMSNDLTPGKIDQKPTGRTVT